MILRKALPKVLDYQADNNLHFRNINEISPELKEAQVNVQPLKLDRTNSEIQAAAFDSEKDTKASIETIFKIPSK